MTLKEKISLLPHSPGVYRYYDSEGIVIYIGKAKDLHKRVAQYFVSPDRLSRKTAIMVSKIADIQYSVVDSEADALLLENNLIKEFSPRYNILLKDSKTYPWICISGENFPRVFLTRRVVKDGSRYFGPYSSVYHARNLVDFFHSIYPLKRSTVKIDASLLNRKHFRPCLNYSLKRCLAPCIDGVSASEYSVFIEEIVRILRGGGQDVAKHYKNLMMQAAANMDFELANDYKNKMQSIENHYSKSVVVSAATGNIDVFSLVIDNNDAFGNFLRVRAGAIIQSLNLAFKLNIEEEQSTILASFIAEIQSKFGLLSREVLVPFYPDVEIEDVEFKIPLRGEKQALLTLSLKNAKEARFNALKQREHTDPDNFRLKVLEELQQALGMSDLPRHIECFDNSNIQGTNPVSACVVFKNGQPSKKDYRHFIVKTVEGPDDYASMKEVVRRRYTRLLEESSSLTSQTSVSSSLTPDNLPQLIVIDGGRGQLNSAYEVLFELGLTSKLMVVGLAKRLEEIIMIDDPYPLFLDRNSQALKLLQRLRDEAHRFGITHHRKRRSKAQVKSVLAGIKGVGEKTEQALLSHFGSVTRISKASIEDLKAIVGEKLAITINKELNSEELIKFK